MPKKYISSDNIGNIDFSKDFVFSFTTHLEEKTCSDFVLKFAITDGTKTNEFKISNIIEGYTTKNQEPPYSIVKKVLPRTISTNFFDNSLLIQGNSIFKNYENEPASHISDYIKRNGALFVQTETYSSDGTYIIRKNPLNAEGFYIRPIICKTIINGETKSVSFFKDSNNPIDSNYNETYRIIISDNGSSISFWKLINDSFRLIKIFTYPDQEISEGKVKLEIDSDMELSDLHFTFFEA